MPPNCNALILRLQNRIRKLIALLRVLLVVPKISRFSLNQARLPEGYDKRSLLRVIEQARSALPLRSVLRVVRLSSSRYHHWKQEKECALDDGPSCPRVSPHQLTAAEVEAIRDLATSQEYRDVPTGTLSVLAQRLGKDFASPRTRYRLIHDHQWRRPRQRVHPAKPKIGIRAARPNQIGHIDTTLIRLLDGSRAYLHAVIDNFSRRIRRFGLTTVNLRSTAAAWCANSDRNPELTAAGQHHRLNLSQCVVTSGRASPGDENSRTKVPDVVPNTGRQLAQRIADCRSRQLRFCDRL